MGDFVALSALDCFVASMPFPEARLALAEVICSEVSTCSSQVSELLVFHNNINNRLWDLTSL